MCYYVHTAFAFNVLDGERLCTSKHLNSTLVKFTSHEWGNINTTRFLGRKFDDVLLESFYYQLEKRLIVESENKTNQKHWLRLLLGDSTDQNDCVLRYFIRSSGAFTILHRCNNGGHPVCQCDPIKNNISVAIPINQTQIHTSQIKNNSSEIDVQIESSAIEITSTIVSNSTDQLIISDETQISICNNCTNLIADEDLLNNESTIECKINISLLAMKKTQHVKYRSFTIIVTCLLAVFVVSIIGICLLVRYIRQTCGSYSMRIGNKDLSNPSIIPASREISNRHVVIYNRLRSRPPSATIDADIVHVFSNPNSHDDTIQLLPQSINHTIPHENLLTKDEQEPLYAKLPSVNEK
ncbi:unnamed protein product [Rotaria magnacalcarata]|uniref:Uncharacterized protein n=4 Tax=Rotaria magnacalcarata TaxID=392030 RepID=A0A815T270_9BILA|nr:unnamed protein product [Rotaria magnacalcarata]CAF1575889.1 unnamed protein product [Rotaria magnacalcarata]